MNALRDCRWVHIAFERRESKIEMLQAVGEKVISLPGISGDFQYSVYRPQGDLSADPTQWPNTAMADYYGFEIVEQSGLELP